MIATVYARFARWTALGVWTPLLADLFGRWRPACGGTLEPMAGAWLSCRADRFHARVTAQ
ncbi:hypothetical protein [Azospirillum doebereinerae]